MHKILDKRLLYSLKFLPCQTFIEKSKKVTLACLTGPLQTMNRHHAKLTLPLALALALVSALFIFSPGQSSIPAAWAASDEVQTAKKQQYANWSEIAQEMTALLNKSYDAYFIKDVDAAKKLVNAAYFDFYEAEGFERTVMSYISGKRGAAVEYQFAQIKGRMTAGAPNKEIRTMLDRLITMLQTDAAELDGKKGGGFGMLLASLLIILREGFEAILVVAAIAAYLNRSNRADLVRVVYLNALAAIAASVLTAIILQKIFKISGAQQEILEGLTMLLATVVLFFVSNWMFSKAQAQAWQHYIDDKVKAAATGGNALALGAAAFLAVYREGAETILFYQAMLAGAEGNSTMIWIGFAIGSVALVFVFLLVRYGSLRIPLKPFFLGTSILMYIMAIAFAGGGIKELQEGDLVGVTPLNVVPTIDLLGVYPTLQTLTPQLILVALALFSMGFAVVKARRGAKAA